jgi:glyoxylase-like metal-dependent hydrolase (beta-lactamase superfamily II)
MNDAFERAGLTVFERGWLSSNNVLFGAETAAPVLVDSGYASHAEQTVALVRRALGGRPLGRIVNTHQHSDHCGGNAALQQAFDCAIDVPAGDAAAVDEWDEDVLTFRATGQHCARFRRSGTLVAGTAVRLGALEWQAIASPGHDPHSVVLHQAELGLLISADALWENGFGLVFPALEGADGFGDVRATLERLAGLRVQAVIPGHGPPFTGFEAALERAQRRLDLLVADPARHARHAAKVLVKVHLMELQRQSLAQLGHWLDATELLRGVHRRFGGATAYRAWWLGLVDELVASGALHRSDGMVANGGS